MKTREYIQRLAESYEDTQPDFAKALIKWTPLIESTLYRVVKLTDQDYEDVLQGLLLDLSNVAEYHRLPLYRYDNKVWVLEDRQGKLVKLVSPPMNRVKLMPRWTYWSRVRRLKKSSISSLVYRRITQYLPDVANKHFTQRNGFSKSAETRVVVEKSGKQVATKTKEIWVPKQEFRRVNLADVLNVKALGYNPEDSCINKTLLKGASKATQEIASIFINDGVMSNKKLCEKTQMSARQIAFARMELYRRFKHYKYPAQCNPVHFRAEYIQ